MVVWSCSPYWRLPVEHLIQKSGGLQSRVVENSVSAVLGLKAADGSAVWRLKGELQVNVLWRYIHIIGIEQFLIGFLFFVF